MSRKHSRRRLIAIFALVALLAGSLQSPSAQGRQHHPCSAFTFNQDGSSATIALDPRSSGSWNQPSELRLLAGSARLPASLAGLHGPAGMQVYARFDGRTWERPVGRPLSLQAQHCLLTV